MGKVWVAVITKYEKKQAILVDFHFFSHEDDYNFAYHLIITLPIIRRAAVNKYDIHVAAGKWEKLFNRYP